MSDRNRQSSRAEAERLERALARYEELIRAGRPDAQARRAASARLGRDSRRLFALAVSLPRQSPRAVREGFARSLEARLRREMGHNVVELRPRVRTARSGWVGRRLAAVSAAACIGILAGLVLESSGALPGSVLYPVKRASENAQVWAATGADEARLRLDLAEVRFGEVSGLISRAQAQAVAVPGVVLAAAAGVDDPELVALIQATLQDAEEQISKAAEILIEIKDPEGLDQLAQVAREGRKVTVQAAQDLPETGQPPVLSTARVLQRIEVEAKIVRANAPAVRATPEPCPTPSPSPSAEASPSPSPEATSDASPSPSPSSSPDPCASPSPSPAPEPTPAAPPAPSAEPEQEPEASQPPDASAAEPNRGAATGTQAQDADAARTGLDYPAEVRFCNWFDSLTGRC